MVKRYVSDPLTFTKVNKSFSPSINKLLTSLKTYKNINIFDNCNINKLLTMYSDKTSLKDRIKLPEPEIRIRTSSSGKPVCEKISSDKIQYSNPIKDWSLFSYNKYLTNNIK